MNGQAWRCRLVAELLSKIDFAAIVETGAYRGATTEWLSAFQLPTYSCETSAESYGYSAARLQSISNIRLLHMDSCLALRHVLEGPLAEALGSPILFYLDAHWNEDLPLADEIDIIFDKTRCAVALIDDFQVPDDPGYGYDDYGPGKALTPDYIQPSVSLRALSVFYPATPAARETGARRGCAVLAKTGAVSERLQSVGLLRAQS